MELYYKDLISAEASLEKLVDNLMLVVQGAEELAAANGAHLPEEKKQEIANRLARLKHGCHKIKEQALATALATDKVLHQYAWSAMGFSFALGLVVGAVLKRTSR